MKLVISITVAICLWALFAPNAFAAHPPQESAPKADAISPERMKEKEEVKKRLAEVARGALRAALNGSSPPSISTYDQNFVSNMRKAVGALAARRLAQILLAQRSKPITEQRLREVIASCERIVAKFNERGGDASYPSGDEQMITAFATADEASDMIAKASSLTIAGVMTRGQASETSEAGKRILNEFNQKGADASFQSTDEHIVQTAGLILLAREIIQKAHSPVIAKKLDADQIKSAVSASRKFLAEFSKNGWDAEIDDDDKEAMLDFRQAATS
jgi:hypothetical protein